MVKNTKRKEKKDKVVSDATQIAEKLAQYYIKKMIPYERKRILGPDFTKPNKRKFILRILKILSKLNQKEIELFKLLIHKNERKKAIQCNTLDILKRLLKKEVSKK